MIYELLEDLLGLIEQGELPPEEAPPPPKKRRKKDRRLPPEDMEDEQPEGEEMPPEGEETPPEGEEPPPEGEELPPAEEPPPEGVEEPPPPARTPPEEMAGELPAELPPEELPPEEVPPPEELPPAEVPPEELPPEELPPAELPPPPAEPRTIPRDFEQTTLVVDVYQVPPGGGDGDLVDTFEFSGDSEKGALSSFKKAAKKDPMLKAALLGDTYKGKSYYFQQRFKEDVTYVSDILEDLVALLEAPLTTAKRKSLPDSDFIFPEARKYPIDTKARAMSALKYGVKYAKLNHDYAWTDLSAKAVLRKIIQAVGKRYSEINIDVWKKHL